MNHKIALGTAAIGRPTYINIRQDLGTSIEFSLEQFKLDGFAMLTEAYDTGVRYFDTAPGYGMAEQLLIEWAASRNDPSIEIATKWGYTYVADFDPSAEVHEVKDHTLVKLDEQWIQSKKLLPYLKVYQIHSATFDTKVLQNKAVLRRLAQLKEQHNLTLGITSTGDNQTEVIRAALDVEIVGDQLFDLYQVTYNIFDQSIATLSNELSQHNKKLVIKEALANGRVFPNVNYTHYDNSYKILTELATKYGVGVDAIALRFCIDSIASYKVLSGASNKDHLLDNLKADSFSLDESDIVRLKTLTVNPKEYWAERKRLGWN